MVRAVVEHEGLIPHREKIEAVLVSLRQGAGAVVAAGADDDRSFRLHVVGQEQGVHVRHKIRVVIVAVCAVVGVIGQRGNPALRPKLDALWRTGLFSHARALFRKGCDPLGAPCLGAAVDGFVQTVELDEILRRVAGGVLEDLHRGVLLRSEHGLDAAGLLEHFGEKILHGVVFDWHKITPFCCFFVKIGVCIRCNQ